MRATARQLSRTFILAAMLLAGCSNSAPADENASETPRATETSVDSTDNSTESDSPATSEEATTTEDVESEFPVPTSDATDHDEPTDDGSEAPTCTEGISHDEVLAQYVAGNPTSSQGYEWGPDYAENNWDPCAELSWITLPIDRGTASSPYRILLYHRGEFLGRATFDDYGFYPQVVRLGPERIQVTYTYTLEGEATATASGRAISTFTWDEGSQSIVHRGDVPPNQ